MSINQNNNLRENFYMNLALEQANHNLGQTRTNPSVGCVIVNEGVVVGAGFTQQGGRPHAESIALSMASGPEKSTIKKRVQSIFLFNQLSF